MLVYSVIQSVAHPNCSAIFDKLGWEAQAFHTIRKIQMNVKKRPPDVVMVEFIYGYANNYSGVHVSNVDVLLETLNKYAPQAKLVVFVSRAEEQYLHQLPQGVFDIAKVFVLPVDLGEVEGYLGAIEQEV
jgi:hypothetical protein